MCDMTDVDSPLCRIRTNAVAEQIMCLKNSEKVISDDICPEGRPGEGEYSPTWRRCGYTSWMVGSLSKEVRFFFSAVTMIRLWKNWTDKQTVSKIMLTFSPRHSSFLLGCNPRNGFCQISFTFSQTDTYFFELYARPRGIVLPTNTTGVRKEIHIYICYYVEAKFSLP